MSLLRKDKLPQLVSVMKEEARKRATGCGSHLGEVQSVWHLWTLDSACATRGNAVQTHFWVPWDWRVGSPAIQLN